MPAARASNRKMIDIRTICSKVAALAAVALLGASMCMLAGGQQGKADISNAGTQPATSQAAASLPVVGSFFPGDPIGQAGMRNVLWTARLGTHCYSRPAIAGDRIYIGTNDSHLGDERFISSKGGAVVCLDRASGKMIWRLVVPRVDKPDAAGFDDMNLGICSSPAVEGDLVYVVTNRAEVLCLDAAGQADGNAGTFTDEGQYMAGEGHDPVAVGQKDGDIIWRFDMPSQVPCAPHDAANSDVLVDGDFLYIGTSNGIHRKFNQPTPMPDAPGLIVLDKRTGKLVAQDDEKIGRRMFHGQWSSPIKAKVGDKTLILFGGGDGVLYAFTAVEANTLKANPHRDQPLKL